MRGKNWLAVLVRVVCLVILMVACVASRTLREHGLKEQAFFCIHQIIYESICCILKIILPGCAFPVFCPFPDAYFFLEKFKFI